MPLYEYECDACGSRFEKIQKSYADPPLEVCEKCGQGPVRKLISSPAIQFKGTGWYITDYAKKSGTDAGKTDTGEKNSGSKSETAAKSDAGGTASSDTAATPAPATTKDTKSS
jgi:putative FmdB family regulatory protein